MIPAVMPTYARVPLSFERGEGCWLIDAQGERYLDFASGIAVTALGHAHPRLIAALTEQAGKVWHTSNLFRIPGQERLAEMLVEMTFADTAFFTNSGAEAMECAIKTARKYHSANGHPERWRIITVEGSFHGRTLATIAAAGQDKLTAGFGPMPGGFDHVPFGDLDAMRAAITPETAAICVEPVQGEGGIRPFSSADLKAMRKMCDENGLLLILDEIQTGVGRTGKLFAHELAGVTPDIMAVAKGIGGGFPLGACLATEEAAKGMVAGTHGSTYGGNPLAVAVGATLLEIVSDPAFLEDVRRSAGALRQGLEGLVAAHPDVLEAVRGEGLLIGLKCKVPAGDLIAAAREEKMIVPPAGDNVVRILPPLIVGEEEIAAGLERLDAACRRVEQSAA